MNAVYRLAWCETEGRIMVVSEKTPSGGRMALVMRPNVAKIGILAAAIQLAVMGSAWAADAVCVDPGNPTVVVGTSTSTTVPGSNEVACGQGATAAGTESIAIGVNAISGAPNTVGSQTIAIGAYANATGQLSVAMGANANTNAFQNAIAIGWRASVSGGNNGIAIGAVSISNGLYAVAIGSTSQAIGTGATALGHSAVADGTQTVSIGENSGATGGQSTALGYNAKATLTQATAIGNYANASSTQAIALGTASKAAGYQSTAVGATAETVAGATQSFAGGYSAIASQQFALALGSSARAIGASSTAIGNQARASVQNAIAIGTGAQATGISSISIGTGNIVSGARSTAIGDPNAITGSDSHALGNTNTINANRAFVVGNNVSIPVGMDGAVVLGDASTADAAVPTNTATVGGITYGGFAGAAPLAGSIVSVGALGTERQIKNVAAGQINDTSTDAINGSQLYLTQVAIGNLATTAAANFGGGVVVNPDGSLSAPSYSVGGTTYNNVGDAITNQDRITTQQGNTTAASLGGGSTYNPTTGDVTTVLTVGTNTYNNVQDALGAVNATASAGWNLTAQGANGSNVAPNASVDLNNTDGNILVTKATTSNDVTFNLARDISIDSVTTGNTTINNSGVTVAGGPNGPVSLTNAGLNNGGNTITNVAAGVNDTDAVNVSQLNAITTGVTTAGMNFTGNDSAAGVVHRDLGQTLSIQGQATTVGTYSGANIKTVTDPATGAINIQIADAPKFGNVTINEGDSGKITGVTNGDVSSTSTDAVNGSQLYQTNQTVLNLGNSTASSLGGTSTYDPNTGTVTAGLVVGGTTYNNVNDALQAVSNTAAAARATVTQGRNIVVAATTNADGSTNYQVATTDTLNVTSVTAGNTTVNNQGVSIAGGTGGSVSLGNTGLNNGGNVIRNVAPGVATTDAVNVGQLTSGLSNTLNQANAYTDAKFNDIDNDMWTMRRDYRGATSSAMAMAGLPQAYLPGKSMLAAGVGGYQGEYGIAVGLSGITDNGKWVYKAQASGNTSRDWGFSAGVGIQW